MQSGKPAGQALDDRILTATRVVALIVIPFLLAASAILYFAGQDMGRRFAWDIQPSLTAFYVGSGYLGGAYLFARVVFGHRWHRVAAGFLPVAAFTIMMLVATLVHLDRFDPAHLPFQVWLGIYIVTPLLVAWAWIRNRRTDPGTAETDDISVPPAVRQVFAIAGGLVLVAAIVFLIWPNLAIDIWPWTLSPLTARVLAGWHVLLGAGGLVLAADGRWSAWRIPMQSILLWQALVLVNALRATADLGPAGLLNWYLLYVLGGLLAAGAFYFVMERQHKAAMPSPVLNDE